MLHDDVMQIGKDRFHPWYGSPKFLDRWSQSFIQNDHFEWKTQPAFVRKTQPVIPELDDELFLEVVLVVVVGDALA